jgi:hypothetical protein
MGIDQQEPLKAAAKEGSLLRRSVGRASFPPSLSQNRT